MASSSSDNGGLDLGEIVTPARLAEIMAKRPAAGAEAEAQSRATGAEKKRECKPGLPASGKRFKLQDDELALVQSELAKLMVAVKQREDESNEAFAKDKCPEWRMAPEKFVNGQAQPRELAGNQLNDLLSCDDPVLKDEGAVLVGYNQMQQAINDRVDLSLLGQHGGYSFRLFLEKSNRETATLAYVQRNAEALLRSVPSNGGRYRLTAMQRIATALTLEHTADERVQVETKQHSPKVEGRGHAVVYRQDPGQAANFLINNLSVASGKTWETVFATMSTIATQHGWNATRAAYVKQKQTGRVQGCGLTRGPATDCEEAVCRVVIALVPPPMVKHWFDTSVALATTFGQNAWITWSGVAPLQRASKNVVGIKRILPEAIKLTRERKCALFWVMEANTKSSFAATRTAPNFCIPFRIVDEGTGLRHIEPRNLDPESKYLKTIICNATLEQLTDRTTYQSKHPLRVALNNENLNLDDPGHCALLRMITVPSWMRLAVAQSLAPMMPQGILKISMRVRVTSLSGRLKKTDMIISSTDELIRGLVLQSCGSTTMAQEKLALEEKCRAILHRAVPSVSIAEGLANAIEQVAEDRGALPEITWKPLDEERSELREEDRQYWRDLERQYRAYTNMERLFKQLHDAIAGDPPPECPVTLEPIAPENVCLCPHCAALLDREVTNRLAKCPCCRAHWNEGVVSACQLASVMASAEAEAEVPDKEAPIAAPNDLASLIQAYKTASNDKCGSSLDAVVKSIRIALRYKPKGMRILLCCSVYGEADHSDEARNEQANTLKMRDFIRAACPELTSVQAIGKGGNNLAAYQFQDSHNRVLVVDTSQGSTTMAGLNLQMTDLLIFDRLEREMHTARLVQSIGRIMRAQKRTPQQQEEDKRHFQTHGASVHAPKLVVFIDELPRGASVA